MQQSGPSITFFQRKPHDNMEIKRRLDRGTTETINSLPCAQLLANPIQHIGSSKLAQSDLVPRAMHTIL